ncbi:MAG: PE family protein [Mycobacterium sp.]|nr:MAG: PE family protein [Mycobacterium sp.]
MSYVRVLPEAMEAAAAELDHIASALDEAHRSAVPSILTMAPAAADEVSASIALLFSEHAHDYRAAAGEAAMFQQHLVHNLSAGAASYASAEDVIASLLQGVNEELRYYTRAGNALTNMITLLPLQVMAFTLFPLFWPLLPLFPFLVLQQFLTLFGEVIGGQPISYPYVDMPFHPYLD